MNNANNQTDVVNQSHFKRNVIISIVTGLVFSIVFAIVPTILSSYSQSIIIGLLTAIIGFLISFISEVFSHFEKQDKIELKINELDRLREQLVNHQTLADNNFKELQNKHIYLNNMFERQTDYYQSLQKIIIPKHFQYFFEKSESIDKDILRKLLPKYIESFTCNPNLLSIRGEFWAISCYRELWRNLVQRQKNNPNLHLHVKAVDISYEKIKQEDEYDMTELIELQKEFLVNGGQITRIFIGSEESQDRIKELFETLFMLKNNNDYKFQSYFIDKTHISDNYYNFNDFLIIKDICTCEWSYEAEGIKTPNIKSPNNVKIYSNNVDLITEKWNRIYFKVKTNKNLLLN